MVKLGYLLLNEMVYVLSPLLKHAIISFSKELYRQNLVQHKIVLFSFPPGNNCYHFNTCFQWEIALDLVLMCRLLYQSAGDILSLTVLVQNGLSEYSALFEVRFLSEGPNHDDFHTYYPNSQTNTGRQYPAAIIGEEPCVNKQVLMYLISLSCNNYRNDPNG